MEIEMHRFDYLREANPGLYQRHLATTQEKYGIEPPPQQEPIEQPQEPTEEPQAAQIQQNDDGTLAAADTMGA